GRPRGGAARSIRHQVDELLEPRVEGRPGALALDVCAARRTERVALGEDRGESRPEGARSVGRAAVGARDLTGRDLVLRRHQAGCAYLPCLEKHDAEAFEMRWEDERVRRFEERVLLLIADTAARHAMVLLRNLHARRAGEHERPRATGCAVS